MLQKNILLFALFLSVNACTTIKVDHKSLASRMVTPEVNPATLAYELHGSYVSAQNIVLAEGTFDPIFGTGNTLSTESKIQHSADLLAGGSFSLIPGSLDVFADYTLDSPFAVGLKWQILGEPDQGFRLGMSMALGYLSESDDSSDWRSCTNGGSCTAAERMEASHTAWLLSPSLSFGHRFDPYFMVYSTTLLNRDITSGSLKRPSTGTTYTFSSNTTQISSNIGMELTSKSQNPAYFRGELGYASITGESLNLSSVQFLLFSLGLGFRF